MNLQRYSDEKILAGGDEYDYYSHYRHKQSPFINKCTQFGFMYQAAKFGNLDNMKWIYTRKSNLGWMRYDYVIFNFAVMSGKLECVKWLQKMGCPWDLSTFVTSIEYNYLDITKWLYMMGCPCEIIPEDTYEKPPIFNKSVKYNDLETLSWLKEKSHIWNLTTFNTAVEYANLDTIKWLYENGCSPFDFPVTICTNNIFTNAASRGNLEIMKFIYEIGCPQPIDAFLSAIKHNDISILKWLSSIGCSCVEHPETYATQFTIFPEAAKYGNLEIMKWLREIGCPWGIDAFTKAATFGNIDNMKWLFENGCYFSEDTLEAAMVYGNEDNIRWLIAMGCR